MFKGSKKGLYGFMMAVSMAIGFLFLGNGS